MFCPQCGHRQASNDVRFCARCGLSLGLVTDILANSSDQIQREKRELTGISLMMATVFLLLNFMIVFGAVALAAARHRRTGPAHRPPRDGPRSRVSLRSG